MPLRIVATAKRKEAKPQCTPVEQPLIDQLKRLWRQQIEALRIASAEEDPQEVDRITVRLQSLTTALDAVRRSATEARDHRLTIGVGAAAVLLTGTLLLLRIPRTEIQADTIASEIDFTVAAPFFPLRGMGSAAFVQLSGLTRIDGFPKKTSEQDGQLLRVQRKFASKNPGGIGLEYLNVPAGTLIKLNHTGPGNTIGMRFVYPPGSFPKLDLDVTGDLMTTTLEGKETILFRAPTRITALAAGNVQVIVAFITPKVTFPTPVQISSISWDKDAHATSNRPGGLVAESTILSGKLSLEEFRGRSIDVRRSESLVLKEISDGVIRQLLSDADSLSCQFDGEVKQLFTGQGDHRRNLMPTWLDYIRQQDALIQFWVACGYVAGIGLTVGRWWRGTK